MHNVFRNNSQYYAPISVIRVFSYVSYLGCDKKIDMQNCFNVYRQSSVNYMLKCHYIFLCRIQKVDGLHLPLQAILLFV